MITAAGTPFIDFGKANPYLHNWVEKGEVTPPNGTLLPIIAIYSPDNGTAYPSHNLSLNLDANSTHGYLSDLYYRVSWKPGNFFLSINDSSSTFLYLSTNLTGIPEGANWIEVYAVGKGSVYVSSEKVSPYIINDYYGSYKITGSSEVRFIIDTTSPTVSIMSFENKTFSASDVQLNFTVEESISETSYRLDGEKKVYSGNTTLAGLSNGDHSLTVYAIDKAGNIGTSETVHFRVEVPFPTLQVVAVTVAVVAVVAVAGLVYWKKRKH